MQSHSSSSGLSCFLSPHQHILHNPHLAINYTFRFNIISIETVRSFPRTISDFYEPFLALQSDPLVYLGNILRAYDIRFQFREIPVFELVSISIDVYPVQQWGSSETVETMPSPFRPQFLSKYWRK